MYKEQKIASLGQIVHKAREETADINFVPGGKVYLLNFIYLDHMQEKYKKQSCGKVI